MDTIRIKRNEFDILKKKNNDSVNSDFLAWSSTYLDNHIQKYNVEFNGRNYFLTMKIYFKDDFYDLKIIIKDKILFVSNNEEVENLCENIRSKTKNLYDLMNTISIQIESLNPEHDDYEETSIINSDNDSDDSYYYESEDDWNPYEDIDHDIKESEINYNILQINAKKFYTTNKFNPGKLEITSNFVTQVILKEIEFLQNNCDYIKIDLHKNNIFDFDVNFIKFDNTDLMTEISKAESKGITMNIKLEPNLYPYFPPKVSFKTELKNKLDLAIINLNYFSVKTWNPTNTLEKMINSLQKILNSYAKIDSGSSKYSNINILIQNILSSNNIIPNSIKELDINIDFVKLSESKEKSNDSKYWNKGVGYGFKGRTNWDINKLVEVKVIKYRQNKELMIKLEEEILKNDNNSELQEFLLNRNFFDIVNYYFSEISLVELNDKKELYKSLINIIYFLKISNWTIKPENEIRNIIKILEKIIPEIKLFKKLDKDSDDKKILIEKITEFYDEIKIFKISSEETNDDHKLKYCSKMKELQMGESNFSKYYYKKNLSNNNPSKMCKNRITKELCSFCTSLPLNYNSSVFVRYDPNNYQSIKALIIGTDGTPYENGCFIFDIFIPDNYPNVCPKVNLQTTGGGKVRFNPNLYNSGKVCLSLLGTWGGEGAEKWNKDTSTLLQVLVSIQALIIVKQPYFNEPGYERDINTKKGKIASDSYNDNIRFQTIKWGMIDQLKNPPKEFEEIIKNHFKFKKVDILKTVNDWYSETKISKSIFSKTITELNELIN